MTKKGFTLIELLVTVVIISLFTATAVASLNNYNDRQDTARTGRNIVSLLKDARSAAESGQKSSAVCAAGVDLSGWEAVIGASNIEIRGLCGAARFGSKSWNYPAGVFVLNNMATIPAGSALLFKTLSAGTNGVGSICVNSKYKIIVTDRGEIRDEGFTACP